jgi:hypothetical protein
MKLHRLADSHKIRHRDRVILLIHANHIAHQKIAATESLSIFADRLTN